MVINHKEARESLTQTISLEQVVKAAFMQMTLFNELHEMGIFETVELVKVDTFLAFNFSKLVRRSAVKFYRSEISHYTPK